MSKISKYRFPGDWIMEDFCDAFFLPDITNWTYNGRFVDTDKFDVTPKKEYAETLIRRKQEQIESLERQHEGEEKYYKERLQKLKEEKEKLLRDRDNKP